MTIKRFFIFIFMAFASISLIAQTGTLKIFSEIKDISIYIDEVFIGTDMAEVKNIQKGSHYLKIKKDGIVIHDEIINIQEDATSTIVLKDSPAVQQKMLESMKNEIAQYDSLKLSFDQNMNFYKGTRSITLTEFARTIGNFDIEKRIAQDNKTANILGGVGGATFLTGLTATLLTFSSILLDWPDLPDDIYNALPYIGTASILGCLAGYVMLNASSNSVNYHASKYISIEDAFAAAKKYNDELKKKLGLPETYNK